MNREQLVEDVVKAAGKWHLGYVKDPAAPKRHEEALDEAMLALRAIDAEKPKALKWGAYIVQASDRDWNVQTATHYLAGGEWCKNNCDFEANEPHGGGIFATESAALAALDACQTPPPGYVEPTPLAENAGETATPSLASRVAELERQVIHESRCRIELEGCVESMHIRFTESIDTLRRDVDALRRLNTTDASPAPIEQDTGKVCDWPTSAETSAVSWPIDTMSGAPWNLLDSTGARVAICGYDNDHEKSGPRIAYAIVGMLRNLKTDNETLRREYEREDLAHEQTVKERDEREESLDAFVEAVGGVAVCGEHSNMNDPWANALREVTEAIRERDELRKKYADAVARIGELCTSAPQPASRPVTVTDAAKIRRVLDALPDKTEVTAIVPQETNRPFRATISKEGAYGYVNGWHDCVASLAFPSSALPADVLAEIETKSPVPLDPPSGLKGSDTSGETSSLASRVAEVERQVIHESRCRIELEGCVESMHIRFTESIDALRRDVDALRRLNTSDGSPAPIEQVGADARSLPFGCVAHQHEDGRWTIKNKGLTHYWDHVQNEWMADTSPEDGGFNSDTEALYYFHATNVGKVPPPDHKPASEGRYEVVPYGITASHVVRKSDGKVFSPFNQWTKTEGIALPNDIALAVRDALEARND